MKILAIGDPHGKLPKNLSSIVKKNKIDVIICTGDVPLTPNNPVNPDSWKNFMKKSENNYKDIVEKLCSFGLPMLILRGNMFMGSAKHDKITRNIFSKYKNLIHVRTGKKKLYGQDFILCDMIYEEHNIRGKKSFYYNLLRSNKNRGKKLNTLLKELKNPILVSHAPPFGILDKIHSGKHVGSKILLKAIKKYPPKIVFCSHIHEAKGVKKLGKTIIYNLGSHGDYKIIKV